MVINGKEGSMEYIGEGDNNDGGVVATRDEELMYVQELLQVNKFQMQGKEDITMRRGKGIGPKLKQLARAGGNQTMSVHTTNVGDVNELRAYAQTKTYAETFKGTMHQSKGGGESSYSMEQDQILNTSLDGKTVKCEFVIEHYEDVVNCFKESTVLINFLGRPPNEMDLRKWLQELWSDKGWYIERLRYLGKGHYVVIFDEEVKLEEVLKVGPWHF